MRFCEENYQWDNSKTEEVLTSSVNDSILRKVVSNGKDFFSLWVFFHEHSRLTGQQWKGEAISLTPFYQFHPLHRHLDISRAITAESSPLRIPSGRTRTRSL